MSSPRRFLSHASAAASLRSALARARQRLRLQQICRYQISCQLGGVMTQAGNRGRPALEPAPVKRADRRLSQRRSSGETGA